MAKLDTVWRLNFFWIICNFAIVSSFTQIDCRNDYKNAECQNLYDGINSCNDCLLAGQRKSGLYPFWSNNGVIQLWCDFNQDSTDATTIVHNALETYDVRVGSGFDLIHRQKQASHVDYELDIGKLRRLEDSSAICRQAIMFKNCSSYENLKIALREKRAILLNTKGLNLTERDLASSDNCRNGNVYAVNVSSAIVSVGAEGQHELNEHSAVAFSLGPIFCSGSVQKGDIVRGYCGGKGEVIIGHIGSVSFNFRTLQMDAQLTNMEISTGKWLKISLSNGWFVNLNDPEFHEILLLPYALSDGNWHRVQMNLTASQLRLVVDTNIFIWDKAVSGGEKQDNFGYEFKGCITNLTIHGENCIEEEECNFRVCNPTGTLPCTSIGGCTCQCPSGGDECGNVAIPQTATFPDSDKKDDRNFIWIKDKDVSRISFRFKTSQPEALLAFIFESKQVAHGEHFIQVSLRQRAWLMVHYCNVENDRDPTCVSCSIYRELGFDDLSWHDVSIEEKDILNSAKSLFLLSSDGSCHLYNTNNPTWNDALHVPNIRSSGNRGSIIFLGGTAPYQNLDEHKPLRSQSGYAGFRSENGPAKLIGCISYVRISSGWSNGTNIGRYEDLGSHMAISREQLRPYSHQDFEVKTGCQESVEGCSKCGIGIPCNITGRHVTCNCSSTFMVQEHPHRQDKCSQPRPTSINGPTYASQQCVALHNITFAPGYLKRFDFTTLWMTFQFHHTAPHSASFWPMDLFTFSILNSPNSNVLTVGLESANSLTVALNGPPFQRIQLRDPVVNANHQHFLIIRRLLDVNMVEVQVNDKRLTFQGQQFIHAMETMLMEGIFPGALCVSGFVVQYRNDRNSEYSHGFVEFDMLANIPQNVPRYVAAVRDFRMLDPQMLALKLEGTSYPPVLRTPPKEEMFGESSVSGLAWWIILIIVAVVVGILLILGLIVYFGVNILRRRSGHHRVPVQEWDDDGGRTGTSRNGDKRGAVNRTPVQQKLHMTDQAVPTGTTPSVTNRVLVPTSKPSTGQNGLVVEPLIKSYNPQLKMDDGDSFPELNFSICSYDPSLTLTHDTSSPVSLADSAFQSLQSGKAKLCKFNEYYDIL